MTGSYETPRIAQAEVCQLHSCAVLVTQGGWDLSWVFGTVALGVHVALFFSQPEVLHTTETGLALLSQL